MLPNHHDSSRIIFLERNDIDVDKWDACIDHSFNGNLYGRSWFLDMVAEDWGGLIEGDYLSVFPLPYKKWAGVHFIYQPFFCQQLGLYSTEKIDGDVLSRFIDAIPAKFCQVHLNLNTHNFPGLGGYSCSYQLNHELDLIHPYEKLHAGYNDNLRRNLKKAAEKNLQLMRNPRPEEIISLFRKNRGEEIRHLREPQYQRLHRIIYTLMHRGMAELMGVDQGDNTLVAGAVFVKSDRKAIFLFSGLSQHGKELGAMPWLIDNYIREHAGRHLTFDFDGSNDPNLARFYRSFGSQECQYPRIRIDRLPTILSRSLKFIRWIRHDLRRKSPRGKEHLH